MSTNQEYTFSQQNPPVFAEPNRWRAEWDDQYQRFYFVDLYNNNQSQWEPPAGTTSGSPVQVQSYQQQQTTTYSNNTNGVEEKGMFSSFTNSNTATTANGSTSSKSHTGTMLGAGAGVLGGLLLGNALKHSGGHGHRHNNGGGFGFGGGEGRHHGGPHHDRFGGFGGGPGGPGGGPRGPGGGPGGPGGGPRGPGGGPGRGPGW